MGAVASLPAPELLPDDIIREILLRVPPEPIYLLRASLVCKKWRYLIRDPAFLREFRARRRHAPPPGGLLPRGRKVRAHRRARFRPRLRRAFLPAPRRRPPLAGLRLPPRPRPPLHHGA
ncbi:unnamed protein product [Urochloa humidicola]